jgi:hypothetical protein
MVTPTYIATEQEGGTSTINLRQIKPVTPGERQTLLHRRNEEFSTKQRKEKSVMNSDHTGIEPLKHPEVMINGNTLNFIQYRHIQINNMQYIKLT